MMMMKWGLKMLFSILVFLQVAIGIDAGSSIYNTYNISNMPLPRFQWNENRGYCGEVSTIIASMAFGGFLSQYDLRAISVRYKNNAQTGGEYLVGVNDLYTAKALRLESAAWDSEAIIDAKKFLVWVKQQHLAGHIVTIGIYTNEYLFYGDTDPMAGDPVYDHIVTVYSIGSAAPESSDYIAEDTITISDHGLWNPHGRNANASTAKYLFTYRFDEFQGNRRQANAENGAVYTLPSAKDVGNCGMVHIGPLVADDQKLQSGLVPVKVDSNINYEYPEIEKRSNDRPAAIANVELTITVGPLAPATKYILYRYNDEESIPTSQFNANGNVSEKQWEIQLTSDSFQNTVIMKEIVQSSDKAFYRCVLASAP